MVFFSKEKLHVSAYSGQLQILTISRNSTQNDDEISTSPRDLGILYKTLLAENCQTLKMAAIGRNMQFFPC